MPLPNRRPFYMFVAALFAVSLAACSGGAGSSSGAAGQSGMLPPGSSGTSLAPRALSPVVIEPGAIDGADNAFNPVDGDSASGGNGQTVDDLPCAPTMVTNKYHVHVFLGVVVNGRQLAMPDTIGMHNPGAEVNGFTNTASCFYEIHTHDASGLVHLEVNKMLPLSDVVYHLKNVLDVWGMPHSSTSFGSFSGPMHVYVGNVPLKQTVVSSYVPFTGNIQNIPLRSHEAIWVEIGSTYYTASELPSVTFYTEY